MPLYIATKNGQRVMTPQEEIDFLADTAIVPVPHEVSKPAAIIAMTRENVLINVESDITAMGGEHKIWWDKANTIRRDFYLVESVRVARGWTAAYVDDLFKNAAAIENGG